MKKIITASIAIIISQLSFFSVYSFEDKKSEFGLYFGTKIYEERHPVDNSFFMSQDGWMMGLNANSETYEGSTYLGFKGRAAYGQVDYQSAGTGTMTGIPDYQLEYTGYIGFPFENANSRGTYFTGLGGRYLLNASGLKLSSTGHAGYDRESRYVYMPLGINYEIVTNDQEEGSGMKLTAKYTSGDGFGYEFYMDYWDIADSKLDVSGNFMEPRNTTSDTGLRVFWKY